VGTIYAGAEMLMTLDTTPNQVKRLAANIHRAASRMRELLIDLASATYGNRSTPEICDIREIIAAASEAAAARDGEVRIGATRNRDYVPVAIEDTGPGIPHEIRDKVFEPFVTAGKENGLGLGLAFARQAVLDHGGDMWIRSE